MGALPARVVHVVIDRDWRDVYAFASRPETMAQWASGLAAGLTRAGDDWIADGGPVGLVRVRFAADNAFGVIDHTVTMENGLVVDNALRVTPNGDGAEVTFLLLRRPDMDEAAFEADAVHVRKDLETLKALLER